MNQSDAYRILRNEPFLPSAGDTPGSYRSRVDAYRRKDQEDVAQREAQQVARKQAAQADQAAKDQAKAAKERDQAILSAAKQTKADADAYKADVYTPARTQIDNEKAAIEAQWTRDQKPRFFGLMQPDPKKIEDHKQKWIDADRRQRELNAEAGKILAQPTKDAARATAIEDYEAAETRGKAEESPEARDTELLTRSAKRLNELKTPEERRLYKEELERKGMRFPAPELPEKEKLINKLVPQKPVSSKPYTRKSDPNQPGPTPENLQKFESGDYQTDAQVQATAQLSKRANELAPLFDSLNENGINQLGFNTWMIESADPETRAKLDALGDYKSTEAAWYQYQHEKDVKAGKMPVGIVDGQLYVNPSTMNEREDLEQRIMSAKVPFSQKQAIIERLPELQEKAAEIEVGAFNELSEFRDFTAKNPQLSTPYEQIQAWKEDGKTISGTLARLPTQTKLGLLQGYSQLIQQTQVVIAAGSAVLGNDDMAGAFLDAAVTTQAEDSEQIGQNMAMTGGPIWAGEFVAATTSIIPPLLFGRILGGTGALGARAAGASTLRAGQIASTLGFVGSVGASGIQSATATFADAVRTKEQELIANGMPPEQARRQAIGDAYMPSVLNGISTAAVTAMGGKAGAETIFRPAQIANLAKNKGFRSTVMTFMREAAKDFKQEFTEEMTDQFIQGIVEQATYNPNMTMDEIIAASWQAGWMGGTIGGGISVGKTFYDRRSLMTPIHAASRRIEADTAATDHMTEEQMHARVAEFMNEERRQKEGGPVVELPGFDATNPQPRDSYESENLPTLEYIEETLSAAEPEATDATRTAIRDELSKVKAALTKKRVTPDTLRVASKISTGIDARYARNEAEIAELKSTLQTLDSENPTIGTAEPIAQAQQQLMMAMMKKKALFDAEVTPEEASQFAKTRALAEEIARIPDEPSDPNNNGRPNGASQQAIATAIAKAARGVPLTDSELNMRNAHGQKVFKQGKDGRTTVVSDKTLQSLETVSPQLHATYTAYEDSLRSLQDTNQAEEKAKEGQPKEPASNPTDGGGQGEPEVAGDDQPTRYLIEYYDEATNAVSPVMADGTNLIVEAESEDSALSKAKEAALSNEEISQPKGRTFRPTRLDPEPAPQASQNKPATPDAPANPTGEASGAGPEPVQPDSPVEKDTQTNIKARLLKAVQARDGMLESAEKSANARFDTAIESAEKGKRTDKASEFKKKKHAYLEELLSSPQLETVTREIDRLTAIIAEPVSQKIEAQLGALLPAFTGGIRYIYSPTSKDGGMFYATSNKQLVVNLATVDPSNAEKTARTAVEEWLHAIGVENKIDFTGIWEALPKELKDFTLRSYPALKTDFQKGAEATRLVLQKKIGITEDGKLWWDDGGKQKTTEEVASPDLRAKLLAAIREIANYVRDLLGELRKANADQSLIDEVARYEAAIKAAIKDLSPAPQPKGDKPSAKPPQAAAPAPQAQENQSAQPGDPITINGVEYPTAGSWAAKDPRGPGVATGTVAIIPISALTINTTLGTDQDRLDRDKTGAPQRLEMIRNMTPQNIPLAWDAMPSITDGSPIISPVGSVIAGNNRSMALRDLFGSPMHTEKADAYEQWVTQRAATLGLPAPTEPSILVRVMTDDGGIPDFVKAANRAGTQTKTMAENAIAEARLPADDLAGFYQAAGQPEEMRDSNGRPDVSKVEERIDNAAVARLMLAAPDGPATVTRLIDSKDASEVRSVWPILRAVGRVRDAVAPHSERLAAGISRAAQIIAQEQLGKKNVETSLKAASDQVVAAMGEGEPSSALTQDIAAAIYDERSYSTTAKGNRKFDAEETSDNIAALADRLAAVAAEFNPEADMFGNTETLDDKLRSVISNRNAEKLSSQATLTPEDRDGTVRRAQNLQDRAASGRRSSDSSIPDAGAEAIKSQAASLALQAARDTEQAAAAIGAGVRILDPNDPDGSILSGRKGRPFAIYQLATRRILVAPSLAFPALNQDAARAYLREELIHAAQHAAIIAEFERNPQGFDSPEALMANRYQSIFDDLESTPAGRAILVRSARAYANPVDAPMAENEQNARRILEQADANLAIELVRQLTQLRQETGLTEASLRRAYNTLRKWFNSAVRVLREASKQSPSPILDETIQQTIDLLNGKINTLSSQATTVSPEARDRRMSKLIGAAGYQALQDAQRELSKPTAEFLTYAQIDAMREPVEFGLIAGPIHMSNAMAKAMAKDLIEGKRTLIDKIVELAPIRESELRNAGSYPSSITQYGYERQDRGVYRHVPTEKLSSQSTDTRYLELAKDPEANAAELQKMVDEAAKAAGKAKFKAGFIDSSDIISRSERRKAWSDVARKLFGERIHPAEIPVIRHRYLRESDFPESLRDLLIVAETSRVLSRDADMAGNDILDTLTSDYEDGAIDPVTGINSATFDMDMGFRNSLRSRNTKRTEALKRIKDRTKGVYEDSKIINITSRLPSAKDIQSEDDMNALRESRVTLKSADPVTYDEAGNVIPLSQRFNPDSDSILYSQSTDTPQEKAAVHTYNELTALQRSGTRLTPNQQRALDRAEEILGQQRLFDIPRTYQPAEELALETQIDNTAQRARQGEQLALFSQAPVVDLYRRIGDQAESYKFPYPAPTSNDIKEVAKAYGGEARTSNDQPGVIAIVMPGPGKHLVVNPMRNGRYAINSAFTNTDRDTGNAGSLGYQIAGTWAHNNGFVLVTDGDLSGINILRRTSNMISNILRHDGATSHWQPGADQQVEWEEGNDAANLQALLNRESQIVLDTIPELANIYTDGRGYLTKDQGEPRPIPFSGQINALASRLGPSKGIGKATIRRALLTRSINDSEFRGRVQAGLGFRFGESGRIEATDVTLQALYSQTSTPDERAQAAGQLLLDFQASRIAETPQAQTLSPEQERLVTENMGLAGHAANKSSQVYGWDRDDAMQEASIALMRAARTFDPSKGAKFSTYATRVIANHLTTKSQRRSGMPNKAIRSISLDEQVRNTDGDDSGTRKDRLVSPDITGQETPEIHDARGALDYAVQGLPEKVQDVLMRHAAGETYDEIARSLGMTRQGVSIMASRATDRIRKRLAEIGVTSSDDLLPPSDDREAPLPERQTQQDDPENEQMLDARDDDRPSDETGDEQELRSQSVTPDQARAELGRSHPLTQTVMLADGTELPIGEATTGMAVLGSSGAATTITGTFPQDGPQEMVKITTEDGRTAEASLDHLWSVQGQDRRLTTAELLVGMMLPVNA